MNPDTKWTNLSAYEVADLLKGHGFNICTNTAKKLLKHNDFKKRKIQKRRSLKVVEDRDNQFAEINRAKEDFANTGDPVLSIDTKKKEAIGDNSREGECYSNAQIDGPDHTYASLNTGTAVPHGIYDINNNHAYVNIGEGSETAEFIIDSLLLWWSMYGLKIYPNATRILLLFDSGGANSYLHHLFKTQVIRLCDEMGIEVHIKHYPSYTSKWNPIEHRVFCHIARVIKGVFVRSMDELQTLISRAKTKTGLKVTVNKIVGDYQTGQKGKKEDWEDRINFEESIPKWNYFCSPVF